MKTSRNSNGQPPHGAVFEKPTATLRRAPPRARGIILITGGAGFIGTNVADYFLSCGYRVLLFDNLSRPGVERNLAWIRERHGDKVRIEVADVQDYDRLQKAVRRASRVLHFAAQVAVTTSLEHPFHDFEVNARGTLNLLEVLRGLREPPSLIFTSTNKVYGDLRDVQLDSAPTRYQPLESALRSRGFDERRRLDFRSPHGCSKGAAEQYVLDYARTFGLPAVVFRMSCIYGPHQFGTEDHGWVAHFVIRALEGKPITVYGDGRQVRDVLFVDDLVRAFALAHEHIASTAGQAFNIGGGTHHTISLLELIDLIGELQGQRPVIRFDDWRPADQQFYVSDIGKFSAATGWLPQVSVRDGVANLCKWVRESRRSNLVPVVVPRPVVRSGNGNTDGAPAEKVSQMDTELCAYEPRSKRFYKLNARGDADLEGKIIKFP